MKYLFGVVAVLLVTASAVTWLTLPTVRSDVPVVYWVTGYSEARVQQVDLFGQWMVDEGLVTETGEPIMRLKLDAGNNSMPKKVIQGVSGVAGDVIDIYNGGERLQFYQQIGLVTDLTDLAPRRGFGLDVTWPAVESDITIDGRQYTFPCNVYALMYWVNVDAFERVGLAVPPERWTLDEFERIGTAYVEAANPDGEVRMDFFANAVTLRTLYRSMGLSAFNETLTACTLDDPRFARSLALIHRWTHELHLLPTSSQRSAMASTGSGNRFNVDMLHQGRFALITGGRYTLVHLRDYPDLRLAVVEPPHAGFPNTATGARAAAIFIGSEHADLAAHFLHFLASEPYNMQIVRDADALPPNPRFTRTEAFARPADRPNEWHLHTPFAQAARDIAIGGVFSPFVLAMTVNRHVDDAEQKILFEYDRYGPEQLARRTADRVNAEIQRTLDERPDLRPLYEQRLEQQRRIDERKSAGRPIPAELVQNPFLRRYHAARGMLD